MVSTRGIKPKYDIGERVLCYEPDPKKMKMLYDAKVLGHRPSEHNNGKRGGFDYLVHFLGWNPSWDSYVADDMLMKDNAEGRNEQNVLYQLLESAKKMERKKKRKSTDLRIRASTDSNPSPIPSETSPETKNNKRLSEDSSSQQKESNTKNDHVPKRMRLSEKASKAQQDEGSKAKEEKKIKEEKTEKASITPSEITSTIKEDDGGIKMTISFEKTEEDRLSIPPSGTDNESPVEEDICTEPLPVQFPESLKKCLEKDYKMVTEGNKLVQLPAQPNIVTLLEGFVRKFAINRLSAAEKQIQKNHNPYRQDKDDNEYFDSVRVSLSVCKEVAEGFRILIDFLLGNVLLYPQERDQFNKAGSIRPHMESIERMMADASHLHKAVNRVKKETMGNTSGEDKTGSKRRLSRKKENSETETGLPGSAGSMSSGAETPTLSTISSSLAGSSGQYPQYKQSHQILRELESWKLLPESVYFEEPAPLSLIYGGIHLARFAVHLPDLFVRMRFPNKKVKTLSRFVEFLVEYVTSLTEETFTESVYTNSTQVTTKK